MWAIIKKEVKSYFLSPIAYIFIGLFLAMCSIFFYIDVYFYRKGKGYYFEFDGTNYECNDVTLAELKSNLSLPFNILSTSS